MFARVGKRLSPKRAAIAGALLVVLAAGGYGVAQIQGGGGTSAASESQAAGAASRRTAARTCSETVLAALAVIARRIYHEGVFSERTASARAYVERSLALRKAVERDDPRAARAAARALLATGHMVSLRVQRGGRVLVSAGAPSALAPLHGDILGAGGARIATFVTSVWADRGFIEETNGVTQGLTALRARGRSVAGSSALPRGEPRAAQGTLSAHGSRYAYASFSGSSYPAGRPLRVYVSRSLSSIAPLCAASGEGTLVNTLSRVARLIYLGEGGPHALVQVRRAQRNRPLLRAVAARDPQATRLAIDELLTEHIVRMRVSAGGRLLADVGGPYVLEPVTAPLRLRGRRIGTMTLSIQDDEGYKRLAHRLAGLNVLMYMHPDHPQLVKNSLGPSPGAVPESGPYEYRRHAFRVFTIHAQAFPSGPLRIALLIPIPYR
jgi:hypothetical protein